MTKRTKPKAATTVAPTINSTPPKQAVESDKAESKAKVATKSKQANSTAKKAPTKTRARTEKVVVKVDVPELTQQDKDARILRADVTYVAPNRAILVSEPPPSKYEQFKAWLVFNLYHYTSYFRGY